MPSQSAVISGNQESVLIVKGMQRAAPFAMADDGAFQRANQFQQAGAVVYVG